MTKDLNLISIFEKKNLVAKIFLNLETNNYEVETKNNTFKDLINQILEQGYLAKIFYLEQDKVKNVLQLKEKEIFF